jgi:hypothetical protein
MPRDVASASPRWPSSATRIAGDCLSAIGPLYGDKTIDR